MVYIFILEAPRLHDPKNPKNPRTPDPNIPHVPWLLSWLFSAKNLWLVAPARSGTPPKTSEKTQQDDDISSALLHRNVFHVGTVFLELQSRKRPVSQLRDCRISGEFSLSKLCFWGGFCCFPGHWVTSGAGFTIFAYPHESGKKYG